MQVIATSYSVLVDPDLANRARNLMQTAAARSRMPATRIHRTRRPRPHPSEPPLAPPEQTAPPTEPQAPSTPPVPGEPPAPEER